MNQKTASRQHKNPHTAQSEPDQTSPQQDNGIKHIEKRRLSTGAIWLFFLGYLAKTSLLLLLFFIGFVYDPLVFGLIILVYLIVLYITAAVVRQHYYYEVNGSCFRKEHGIIHKTDVTIPFNQIQNVNIMRGLSDRMLGLARIDIETAGNSALRKRSVGGGSKTRAEAHLPGVTMAQADEIHSLLLERFTQSQQQISNSI